MLGSFVGVADYGAFVAAIIVFLLIPGPGNLALITSTGKGGVAGGMGATFGVIAGDQVLLWAAVAGVSAVMLAYPAAFHVVQWLGAAYLAWLGAKMLLAKPGDAPILQIRPRHYGFFPAVCGPCTASGAENLWCDGGHDCCVDLFLRVGCSVADLLSGRAVESQPKNFGHA
jgi:hypothetical protein